MSDNPAADSTYYLLMENSRANNEIACWNSSCLKHLVVRDEAGFKCPTCGFHYSKYKYTLNQSRMLFKHGCAKIVDKWCRSL